MPRGECGTGVNAEETQAVGGDTKTQGVASAAQRAWTTQGQLETQESGQGSSAHLSGVLLGRQGGQIYFLIKLCIKYPLPAEQEQFPRGEKAPLAGPPWRQSSTQRDRRSSQALFFK